jgi:hypothetical protein
MSYLAPRWSTAYRYAYGVPRTMFESIPLTKDRGTSGKHNDVFITEKTVLLAAHGDIYQLLCFFEPFLC